MSNEERVESSWSSSHRRKKKQVCFLVGPKGAGKSYIGKLVGAKLPRTRFVNVEPMFVSVKDLNHGYAKVEAAIDRELLLQESSSVDTVLVETLGGGPLGYRLMMDSLQSKYRIRYIRVVARPETCLERYQARDPTGHLPVPLDQVARYNEMSVAIQLDWAAVIDNEGPATQQEIIDIVRPIVLLDEKEQDVCS